MLISRPKKRSSVGYVFNAASYTEDAILVASRWGENHVPKI
jgi:hypothetical protein